MRLASILFFLLLGTSNSFADFRLYWSASSSTSDGAPLVVDLFVEETTTSIINQFGISATALRFSRTGVGVMQSVDGNIAFDANNPFFSDPVIELFQSSIFGAGVGSNGVFRLASVTITPTAVGTGSITLVGANGLDDDFLVYANSTGTATQSLGSSIFTTISPFNYSFSAVPEPTSMAMMSLVGLGVLGRKMWQRRRKKSNQS